MEIYDDDSHADPLVPVSHKKTMAHLQVATHRVALTFVVRESQR
jgi:hypothetical protein